jgi:hypothetical protein
MVSFNFILAILVIYYILFSSSQMQVNNTWEQNPKIFYFKSSFLSIYFCLPLECIKLKKNVFSNTVEHQSTWILNTDVTWNRKGCENNFNFFHLIIIWRWKI